MAKLPDIKRILKEDLGNDVPEYIDKIIGPVNSLSESVYQALGKQITFADNITSSIKTLEVTTSAVYPLAFPKVSTPSGITKRADGVLILQIQNKANLYAPILTSPFLSWLDTGGNIEINHISGLLPSTTYIFKILII